MNCDQARQRLSPQRRQPAIAFSALQLIETNCSVASDAATAMLLSLSGAEASWPMHDLSTAFRFRASRT
jgi:hypothetical protein